MNTKSCALKFAGSVFALMLSFEANAWMDQWAPEFKAAAANVEALPKVSVSNYVCTATVGGEFRWEYCEGYAIDLNDDGTKDQVFIIPWMGNGLCASGYDVHFMVSDGAKGRKKTIMIGIILLAACFLSGFFLTTAFHSINAIMFIVFALVGFAWAAINVNSLPMVVEMCRGSDIGKFTGYYYTASMAAQVVTPILAGTLMRSISYKVLFPYAAIFVFFSFLTMTQVKHGDAAPEVKKGLEAFEDMED